MIVRVFAPRASAGGTTRYLLGEGHTEHLKDHQHRHTDQHVIGGLDYPGADRQELGQRLAADLDANAKAARLAPGTKCIQHIALALSPAETATLTAERNNGWDAAVLPAGGSPFAVAEHTQAGLSDAKWSEITQDYLREMGWQDARYTVVRHGLAADGGDHVHILLSDVLTDGSRLDTFRSGKRSQAVATGLESRHGLQVLQSRREGISAQPLTSREAGMSRRTSAPVPRQQLETTMRAAAVGSRSEADYFDRLTAQAVQHRFSHAADGSVRGYSVRTGDMPEGVWFGAGKVARDLSLPQIRARGDWSAPVPVAEPVGKRRPWSRKPEPVPVPRPDLAALGGLVHRRQPVDPHALSGALAAVSRSPEIDAESRGKARRASAEVGRFAQTRKAPVRRQGAGTGTLNQVVRALGGSGGWEAQVVIDLLLALAELHRLSVQQRNAQAARAAVQTRRDQRAARLTGVGRPLAARQTPPRQFQPSSSALAASPALELSRRLQDQRQTASTSRRYSR